MKTRRSERLIDMTRYLLERPHTLISLAFFAKRFESAKSSISEDLGILRRTFMIRGIGVLETLPGAGGGVIFTPGISKKEATEFIEETSKRLVEPSRILPGGYLYLTDLLAEPDLLRTIGRMIATQYSQSSIDVVMTVATKGIPIAQSVASFLNIPFVIVRRDSKITEGSTISVNYASGSSDRIEKMELSKRSLDEGSRVLVVDDFMKGGGTINGMRSLISEFNAIFVGATVFAENIKMDQELRDKNVTSIFKVENIDTNNKIIRIDPGDYLTKTDFSYFE
ncbi:pur operon repressor [Companilactobacillus baiquanensis]|uniref:Pur operon repressor n=1 Tax=Companilactobacillus baiquanensis TaxID=2486005 RepID=A0ABW1USY0_9LACO|nr:pur operon repressor [Companilactobacillus baiquanensis]